MWTVLQAANNSPWNGLMRGARGASMPARRRARRGPALTQLANHYKRI
jgi:hypothetical protein